MVSQSAKEKLLSSDIQFEEKLEIIVGSFGLFSNDSKNFLFRNEFLDVSLKLLLAIKAVLSETDRMWAHELMLMICDISEELAESEFRRIIPSICRIFRLSPASEERQKVIEEIFQIYRPKEYGILMETKDTAVYDDEVDLSKVKEDFLEH